MSQLDLVFSHFSLNWDPSLWGWASYTKFFDNIIFFGQYCNKKISDFFTFLSEVRSLLVRLGKGSRQMGATASQSTKLRKIFNLCWNIWGGKIWKDENIFVIGVEMHQIVQSWTIGRWRLQSSEIWKDNLRNDFAKWVQLRSKAEWPQKKMIILRKFWQYF